VNQCFFKDTRTIQLFDRYATYNGSDPYATPATFHIIPHVEFAFGAFNVQNGIHAIPRALSSVARKKGVNVYYHTPVQGITIEHKRATGIMIKGEFVPYDIVISNADVHFTYAKLLKDRTGFMARVYQHREPSSSALVFYFGVKGSYDRLHIHNILFSRDYQREFMDIFLHHRCPREPTIYINITGKYVPDDAPPDHENWFVMVNAPADHGQDWQHEIEYTREQVLSRIERFLDASMRGNIVFEATLSPVDLFRTTHSVYGSIYGLSSNTIPGAFFRQQNRSMRYAGLYFCGGSAHPGGGMPLAVLSGKITADLITSRA
jgi:phytoene desaturase